MKTLKKKNSFILKYIFFRIVYPKKLKKKYQGIFLLKHFLHFFFGSFKKKKLLFFVNSVNKQKHFVYKKLFNFFILFYARLDQILFLVKFGSNLQIISQYIKNGLIFINNQKILNLNFILQNNDFVTLHKVLFNYLQKKFQLKKLLLFKYKNLFSLNSTFNKDNSFVNLVFITKKNNNFLVNYTYFMLLMIKPLTLMHFDNKISRRDLNSFYLSLK